MRKPIPKEKYSKDYDWVPTNSCLAITTSTDNSSRSKSMDILSSNSMFWIRVKDLKIDAIVRGSEDDYMVNIDFSDESFGDFVDGSMSCECKAFEFRDGPCKHVCAVALDALVRREGGEYERWARSACSESRNSGIQYKPWESKPEVNEVDAAKYGAEVVKYKKHRKEVKCYQFENGKRWTGELPLPKEGESVITKLPTGNDVKAEVLEPFMEDENDMIGYWVKLSEIPEHYSNDTIVVYGTEIKERCNNDVKND